MNSLDNRRLDEMIENIDISNVGSDKNEEFLNLLKKSYLFMPLS